MFVVPKPQYKGSVYNGLASNKHSVSMLLLLGEHGLTNHRAEQTSLGRGVFTFLVIVSRIVIVLRLNVLHAIYYNIQKATVSLYYLNTKV